MVITIIKTDTLGNSEQSPFFTVADQDEAFAICEHIAERSNYQLECTFNIIEGV